MSLPRCLPVAHRFTADSLKKWMEEVGAQRSDGTYGPTRPMPYTGLFIKRRFLLAWRVFTGRADVVEWLND